MSTKHIRNAADLVRFRSSLKITCERCGNAQTISGVDAAKVAGRQELAQLKRRLKCSLCGAREAKLMTIQPPPKRAH